MNAIAKPFVIGAVRLQYPVILAPMAGVCDLPYRVIARQYGAAMVCTEMISGKGLLYHNKHTQEMLRIDAAEHPLSMQIFGADCDSMARAAVAVEEAGADIVDINMGCPVNKVVRNGEGSAVMKDLNGGGAIIRAVVQAVAIAVTVKMRTGWDNASFTAPELAKGAGQAGAAGITVHGRTREQFYSGRADLDKIRQVVAAVRMPVSGNGDIVDGITATRMMEQTGCQAVMIGRGAQGNPWIFRQICHYWDTGENIAPPGPAERYKQMLTHFESLVAYKGSYIGLREMRSHAAWYTKGMHGSARLREQINRAQTVQQFEQVVRNMLEEVNK